MHLKRAFDVVVALLALLAAAPLLLLCAVAVRLDSPGPVLFRQERVGLGGASFTMFKFRSMVVDADRAGPYYTAANDPRITRVGAWLRKTSLDELPQLINVLFGNMSLVGPRPDVPAQRKNYTDEEWALRHRVRPGITGPAQVSGRSQLEAGARKRLDLEYAAQAGLSADLKILGRTVVQLLRGNAN